MYNLATITAGFDLIGWHQNTGIWKLTRGLASTSGMYFCTAHPMLTLDNLASICPRFDVNNSLQTDVDEAFTTWLERRVNASIQGAIDDILIDSLGSKGSGSCDITDILLNQISNFRSVIHYRVGMDLLRELIHNPNSNVNRNESNISPEHLQYELNGDSQGKDGFSMYGKYKRALKGVVLDVSEIKSECFGCKKAKINYKTIG